LKTDGIFSRDSTRILRVFFWGTGQTSKTVPPIDRKRYLVTPPLAYRYQWMDLMMIQHLTAVLERKSESEVFEFSSLKFVVGRASITKSVPGRSREEIEKLSI
jgi:hypothetical protein